MDETGAVRGHNLRCRHDRLTMHLFILKLEETLSTVCGWSRHSSLPPKFLKAVPHSSSGREQRREMIRSIIYFTCNTLSYNSVLL